MSQSEIKKDKYGFEYYDLLPDGYRIGCMDDFHVKGRKKVGMKYLIKRAYEENHYEIHYVKEWTEGIKLLPFFQWDMIFVREPRQMF